MKKLFLLMLFFVPIISGCTDLETSNAQKLIDYNNHKYDDLPLSGELVEGVRIINVKAYQFRFEPEIIIVNKGDHLLINVSSMDAPHGFELHGFEIPGYDINTEIRPGIPLELDFYALETGLWEFVCSVYCGFGHGSMTGVLVVR